MNIAPLLSRFLIVLLILLPFGCGKKAPPYLPASDMIPVATDLKAEYTGGGIRLTWTVPKDQVRGVSVYRSKISRMTQCKKCPAEFDKIADVPVRSEAVMMYTEKIEPGYKYLYKVRAYTDAASGPDSQIAEFFYY
jgi:predicted small lipoprotein YifL